MASEIRVNKINSQTGVGTITLSPTGVDISGITTVSTLKVGTGVTASEDGDIFFTGVCTATTFAGAHSGSGANLTNLPAANLTGALPAISGANLTGIAATDNVRTGILDVAGIATFRNDVNVGAAVTISESGIEASGIGITVANINGDQLGGRRNIIINGNMVCHQRRGTITFSNSAYSLDRWLMRTDGHSGAANITKSTTSPDGFQNSLKVDITTADTSLTGGEYFFIDQRIEANNIHHAAYGNSGAKTMTLSFYVRSNKTGTYNVNLYNPSSTRQLSRSYTINSADTWERKILRIPGDTSGGLTTGTGAGMRCNWYLAAGTSYTSGSNQATWSAYSVGNTAPSNVNLLDSTSNEWYLTGVQLEIGSEATPYEHRSFGEELALCQRYFYAHSGEGVNGSTPNPAPDTNLCTCSVQSTASVSYNVPLPVPMRTQPTLYSTVTGSTRYRVNSAGANQNSGSDPTINSALTTHTMASGSIAGFSNLVAGQAANVRRYQGTGVLGFSAEL